MAIANSIAPSPDANGPANPYFDTHDITCTLMQSYSAYIPLTIRAGYIDVTSHLSNAGVENLHKTKKLEAPAENLHRHIEREQKRMETMAMYAMNDKLRNFTFRKRRASTDIKEQSPKRPKPQQNLELVSSNSSLVSHPIIVPGFDTDLSSPQKQEEQYSKKERKLRGPKFTHFNMTSCIFISNIFVDSLLTINKKKFNLTC